tara:strand:- start:141 stop:683 length:543 start_codon:yes stop_codon:yes gene_type:complete
MMWFKVEGIVYSSMLILLLNLNNQISKKTKIYSTIAFFLLVLLKISIYQFFNEKADFLVETSGHPYYLEYIYNLNIDFIFYKMKIIIPYLVFYIFGNIFFILGIFILLILNFKKKTTSYVECMNFYFVLNLGFIFCAYLFRDMEIEYSLRTTMERVVFTSSGFFVFLVLNYVKDLGKNLD